MLMGNMEQVRDRFGGGFGRRTTIEPRPDVNYVVLLAEPNREMTAQANLIIRRVPFYLPTIFRMGRLSPRLLAMGADRPDIPMALFPRVLFVAEDEVDCHFEMIRTAPGMLSHPFMRFGERVAMLRPIDMQVVKAIEASERHRYLSRKNRLGAGGWMPEIGDEVRFLLDDVLSGITGTVSEIDDHGRITVLTELLKRATPVKNVTLGRIEPV